MAFFSSIFGGSSDKAPKVDTQAVNALGRQVQSTFDGVHEYTVFRSITYRNTEIKELPGMLCFLQEETIEVSEKHPTLQQLIDRTNQYFVQRKAQQEQAFTQQKNWLMKAYITPQSTAQITILNKMSAFVDENQGLIREVKALKKNAPKEFFAAIAALAEGADKEVAEAIKLLTELNMNGVIPHLPVVSAVALDNAIDDFVIIPDYVAEKQKAHFGNDYAVARGDQIPFDAITDDHL